MQIVISQVNLAIKPINPWLFAIKLKKSIHICLFIYFFIFTKNEKNKQTFYERIKIFLARQSFNGEMRTHETYHFCVVESALWIGRIDMSLVIKYRTVSFRDLDLR
jgi:hypothetical protein